MLHGARSYLLQDDDGQVIEAHSISAGLDYPGVGPEHAYLKDTGRADYVAITDAEALEGFQLLCRDRGHHPGAGAVARHRLRRQAGARRSPRTQIVLINLSGRGDKDMGTVAALGVTL